MMKRHKNNTVKGKTNHHNSSGLYFSYGNRANFGLINNSSVSQYLNRKTNTGDHFNGKLLEELSQEEQRIGISSIARRIPIIRRLISPIIQAAYELQSNVGDINLKETSSGDTGLWMTTMCANAETKDFHHENDCTYTIIHVPKMAVNNGRQPYHFVCKLKDTFNVSFHLKPFTTIMFSGQCLTHRQTRIGNSNTKGDPFINFTSYGNGRLFRHIRNSFERIKSNN